MKKLLYEDLNKIIHLCESSEVYKNITLIWTKCEKDVPANKAFLSEEKATCQLCSWADYDDITN